MHLQIIFYFVSISFKKLILLDTNEYALYEIKKEIESHGIDSNIFSVLGNVTNKERVIEICKSFKVDTIYYAAAYKHVPLVEENPFEGVVNNIFGTLNCLRAASEAGVDTFVLISTDKAVRPTNIMGATKRFSEMILQSISSDEKQNNGMRMTMVRFGNVLASSGSAIPLFQQQIRTGGPVTVTHPEIIRYFMTIPEAAQLVIQATFLAQGGEVFLLDMGKPVKISSLAKQLIELSGLKIKDINNPDGDIEIKYIGLRPGEKLFEELLVDGKSESTSHSLIYKSKEDFIETKIFWANIEELCKKIALQESDSVLNILKKLVPEWEPFVKSDLKN